MFSGGVRDRCRINHAFAEHRRKSEAIQMMCRCWSSSASCPEDAAPHKPILAHRFVSIFLISKSLLPPHSPLTSRGDKSASYFSTPLTTEVCRWNLEKLLTVCQQILAHTRCTTKTRKGIGCEGPWNYYYLRFWKIL